MIFIYLCLNYYYQPEMNVREWKENIYWKNISNLSTYHTYILTCILEHTHTESREHILYINI